MSLQGEKGKQYYQKAVKHIPFGVNSNFRYWGENDTLMIAKGDGPYIWDVDGKRYIDYRLGFGPVILGHNHPVVTKAVQQAIEGGTVFALTTPGEVELAERFTRMCKVDKVRLTNTGTEACMHALRFARAYTGREKFIKFEGTYHGMADYFMFSTAATHSKYMGVRNSSNPVAMTSGIPRDLYKLIYTLPFNDEERLEKLVESKWHEIAAIIFEPVMGNVAGIMPQKGYLEKMRQLCDKYGIVMLMDEVKTGFRLANGGAQEYFGIKADLLTYAKSMGNGFPIAAIGGKEEIMSIVGPGNVAHAGTYSGNVVGVAAANATLEILETTPVIEDIFRMGTRLMEGLDSILTEADVPHAMTGVPSMPGYVLGKNHVPAGLREYNLVDTELYEKIGMKFIEMGVMPEADAREPWFLCHAHTQDVIDETLNIFKDAVWQVVKK